MADLACVAAQQFLAQVHLGVGGQPCVPDGAALRHQRIEVDHVQPGVLEREAQQPGIELPPQGREFGT